jgi:hypothetical protein
VAVPADVPVTIPVVPILALPVLLQVPPPVPSVKDVVDPEHTLIVPVIGAGTPLAVTIIVA